MKNLMVYMSGDREIDNQSFKFLQVQLENCYELGWKRNDVVLLTNADVPKTGVDCIRIPDEYFSAYSPISTKVSAVCGAFDCGLLDNSLYWLHDLDAWQCEPIDIDIPLNWDIAACYFGRLVKWSGGSIFFRRAARDIFNDTMHRMYRKKLIDEVALTEVAFDDEEIHNRIMRLNPTYNFVPFNIGTCWRQATKPLKVAHFNPLEGVKKANIPNLLEFYKGDNRLKQQFIPDRLISLFERHGIR